MAQSGATTEASTQTTSVGSVLSPLLRVPAPWPTELPCRGPGAHPSGLGQTGGRWGQILKGEREGPMARTPSRKEYLPWPVWLSWLEHHLGNQKVASSVPSWDTCLGCRFSPHVWEATDPCFSLTSILLSLSLSLPSSLSPSLLLTLKSISMSLVEDLKKEYLCSVLRLCPVPS